MSVGHATLQCLSIPRHCIPADPSVSMDQLDVFRDQLEGSEASEGQLEGTGGQEPGFHPRRKASTNFHL